MPVFDEYYVDSSDCVNRVRTCKWMPEGKPRAVLQLVHGITENMEQYDALARFFAEKGFAVVGNDHLGHGRTCVNDEDRLFFADGLGWFLVLEDMHRLCERTKEELGDIPYFMLGHSLGSFLARTFLINYPGEVSGCILTGTGQQSPALCGLGLIAAAFETLRLGNRGRSKWLNRQCFGSYNVNINERPGMERFSLPTNALVRDMLGGIRYIQKRSNLALMDKSTPVLFLSGENDAVGGFGKGVEKAEGSFRSAGCSDVTVQLLPDTPHKLFGEGESREKAFKAVFEWLESKI